MSLRHRWIPIVGGLLAACTTSFEPVEQGLGGEPPLEPTVEPEGEVVTCAIDDEAPPHVYVRRVKNLLTGQAPTPDELALVQESPAALTTLVEQWTATTAYEAKLATFLRKSLQLDVTTPLARQIVNSENNANMLPLLQQNVRESYLRTALRIAQGGRPFSDIVEGRTWQMTTATMAWMVALDGPPAELGDIVFYAADLERDGVTYTADTPVAEQIAGLTFHAPAIATTCDRDPYTVTYGRPTQKLIDTLSGIFGHNRVGGESCVTELELFGPEDYADWRDVVLTAPSGADPGPAFYDVVALREAEVLPLRTPRGGFFTHPTFLAGWETNADNSFRVTINQTLIAALGVQFDSEDVTTPLGDEGLAVEHADPTTACYGCHKNLDPMRNYFKNALSEPFYAAPDPEDHEVERASFSFAGLQGDANATGETLTDLGRYLASHPRFAPGWVQKVCTWANSTACDENDPEFVRLVAAFEASGLDFRAMVIDLFTSPLVTQAACAEDYDRLFPDGSIARRDHLCATVAERLGMPGLCDQGRNGIDDLARTLPEDGWSRGRETPELAATPSLVYAATIDAFCTSVAGYAVDRDSSPLQSRDVEGSLTWLVSDFMALPPSDPRHEAVLLELQAHQDAADAIDGVNTNEALRATFAVACASPFVALMDL